MRDALVGRPAADIDVAVPGDPHAEAERVAAAVGGSLFALAEERGTWRVTYGTPRREIDITAYGDSIEADLTRRDFTIDSMATPLADTSHVVDPHGGRGDLEARRVRLTQPDAFRRDGARLLRAVRLAAELGFAIEAATRARLQADGDALEDVAWERKRDELMRLLACDRASWGLAELDRVRLLDRLVPELVPSRDCEQPEEHTWDVLRHQLETVRVADTLFAGAEVPASLGPEPRELRRREVFWAAERAEEIAREVQAMGLALFKLACLVHDIGKPATKAEIEGRTRFFGHPQVGAELAATAMRRLRFSGREVADVELLVKDHLRPGQLASPGEAPTRRALARFFRDLGSLAVPLLVLQFADAEATLGPRSQPQNQERHVAFINAMIEVRDALGFSGESRERLVTGADIMESLRLEPGPEVGRILREIEDAVDAGDITTRAEALAQQQGLTG